jgi:Ca-activated chloride channel family protein
VTSALLTAALVAAVAIPVLVALGSWLFRRRGVRVARAFPRVGRVSRARLALAMLAALAVAGALVTAARAAARGGGGGGAGAGGAVVLVLDVSNSMLARDVQPDRLTQLRATARQLLTDLAGTPVGIVVFAGRAYALSPPTTDPEALEMYLDALDPEMVTQTGTSLSAAVRQAVGLLATTRGRTGSIVLISDGNAQESPAELKTATAIAARAGIPIHTVGIGTPAGAPVPRVDFRTGRRNGFIPDSGGGNAISRLDERLLRELADGSGGTYRRLGGGGGVAALGTLAGGGGGRDAREPNAYWVWLAAAAVLLLAAESVIARLRSVDR